MNQLEQIESFGSEDAENDQNLIEYFYVNDVINQISEYRKALILGRKGTGKTAIYKYMVKKNNNVASLTFSDYPWRIHDNFENKYLASRESYKQSWLFFFYIEIFKLICRDVENFEGKEAREIKKLERWIVKNYGRLNFNHKMTLTPKRNRFKFIFSPSVFGFSLGSISREIEHAKDIGETLNSFIHKFDEILKTLSSISKNSYYLLFDELDLAYNREDANYLNRLVGLLLAQYQFFQNYKKPVFIYIFLRNDIFNVLEFQDKKKSKMGFQFFWIGIQIEWMINLV